MSTINVVTKTADQGTNSTSYVDIDDLNFEVGVGMDYQFQAALVVSCSSALAGIQVAVNGPPLPAQVTLTFTGFSALGTSTSTNANTYDSGVEPTLSAGTSRVHYTIRGTIRNGATAGVVSLRVKSSSGGATVTVHQGSSMVYNTP